MGMSLTGRGVYFALKTAFQGEDYNQCAAEKASHTLYRSFWATASDVLSVTKVGTGARLVANQKSSNDNKKAYTLSSSDKETIEKALTNGTNIPKTLWKKMSCKDQVAFCGKRRAKRDGVPEHTPTVSPLPPQYNQAHHGQVLHDDQGNRYEVIPRPELKDESSTSTISSNSSNLQRAKQLVRWTANIATYQISPNLGRTLSLKSHHQQSATTGHLIIDSGTNVSVMGRTWAVVDETGQRCEMSGFANDLVKSDIPVCSGKTVVEVGTQKVLISLHEALYLKHNEHGLLSTGQLASTARVSTILFVAMVVGNASQVKTTMGCCTTSNSTSLTGC